MAIIPRVGQGMSEYYMNISQGKVSGQAVANFYGYIPDLDTGDGLISFWDEKQQITFPSAAGPIYISSESASDVGGTFIASVLDVDYLEHTAIGFTNGQNAAQMTNVDATKTNDFIWVNSVTNVGLVPTTDKVYVSTTNALSGGKPIDTSTILSIVYYDTTEGFSHERGSSGAYVVPGNKSMYVTAIRRFIGKNKDADIVLCIHPYSEQEGQHTVPLVLAEFEIFQVNAQDDFITPSPVPSKTRIQYAAKTDNNNSALSVDTSFILVDNP